MNKPYDAAFFGNRSQTALRSARKVAPFVYEIVRPTSVVDIGCGTGSWLKAFTELGISDIVGVDGEYVDAKSLEIPLAKFVSADVSKTIELGRKFDLAICLEVAEHIPASSESLLLKTLVDVAPVILFSAAIPFQGGTQHVNEQWQDYWVKRFAKFGYQMMDILRSEFWQNEDVAWWYAQNAFLFVHSDSILNLASRHRIKDKPTAPISMVHPTNYLDVASRLTFRQASNLAVRALAREILPQNARVLIKSILRR